MTEKPRAWFLPPRNDGPNATPVPPAWVPPAEFRGRRVGEAASTESAVPRDPVPPVVAPPTPGALAPEPAPRPAPLNLLYAEPGVPNSTMMAMRQVHAVGHQAWGHMAGVNVHERVKAMAVERFACASLSDLKERELRHLTDEIRMLVPPPHTVIAPARPLRLPPLTPKRPPPPAERPRTPIQPMRPVPPAAGPQTERPKPAPRASFLPPRKLPPETSK
jgi:hypothetical protein